MNLLEHLFLFHLGKGESNVAAFERAAEAYDYFQGAAKSIDQSPGLAAEFGTIVYPRCKDLPLIEEELRWRTVQTWAAHLAENDAFYLAENGVKPKIAPTLTPDIRKDIRDALKLYDHDLLGDYERPLWLTHSKVRAAGVGIFLDPFLTGNSKDNNVKDGGKRYLEHWRPWRNQRGKGHPVERFAQLYFEARDVRP